MLNRVSRYNKYSALLIKRYSILAPNLLTPPDESCFVGWIKRSGSTFLTFNFGGSAMLDPPYSYPAGDVVIKG
ncbi:hypothetical protein MNBD_GAMMA10-991 [hydrothermal vent metagenome]|uniref:Uncharacterized protein n=1 Tax=hydrothermal vent metagenome TaxID=652676 RepID=A0A3B0Y298_9ZZZZ